MVTHQRHEEVLADEADGRGHRSPQHLPDHAQLRLAAHAHGGQHDEAVQHGPEGSVHRPHHAQHRHHALLHLPALSVGKASHDVIARRTSAGRDVDWRTGGICTAGSDVWLDSGLSGPRKEKKLRENDSRVRVPLSVHVQPGSAQQVSLQGEGEPATDCGQRDP